MKDWSDLEERYQDMRSSDPKLAEEFKQRMTLRYVHQLEQWGPKNWILGWYISNFLATHECAKAKLEHLFIACSDRSIYGDAGSSKLSSLWRKKGTRRNTNWSPCISSEWWRISINARRKPWRVTLRHSTTARSMWVSYLFPRWLKLDMVFCYDGSILLSGQLILE